MLCALLEGTYDEYDSSLTYIGDNGVLFWHPPSGFPQLTPSPFIVGLVEYNCTENVRVASKARQCGNDTAISAILASNNPREKKRLGHEAHQFDPALW